MPPQEQTIDLQQRLQAAVGAQYRILRELGGGGMSRVFLAEETRLGRQVVIKLLPPEMGAAVNVERFEREIQLAARLQHPHIVPLLTAGASGDLLYYVMPFISGESLRIKLAREGELPVVDAVREHETFVAGEVLATSVEYAPVLEPTLLGTVSDGHEVRVLVTPAPR